MESMPTSASKHQHSVPFNVRVQADRALRIVLTSHDIHLSTVLAVTQLRNRTTDARAFDLLVLRKSLAPLEAIIMVLTRSAGAGVCANERTTLAVVVRTRLLWDTQVSSDARAVEREIWREILEARAELSDFFVFDEAH
jgi:hypothetical protein